MRRWTAPLAWLLVALLAPTGAFAADPVALPAIVVYAPSPCLACIDWADHLRQNGFVVTIEEKLLADMPKIKRWLNVPTALESVHTAKIGRYFVEGHVPAEDILLLLKEQPRRATQGDSAESIQHDAGGHGWANQRVCAALSGPNPPSVHAVSARKQQDRCPRNNRTPLPEYP